MIKKGWAKIKGWIFTNPYTKTDIIASALAIMMGVLILNADAPLADKLIGIFGVLTVLLRITSTVSFGLALICLVDIPLLTLLGREGLAESFAVYAFYFLIIGVINSLLEDQPEKEYQAIKRKQFRSFAQKNPRPEYKPSPDNFKKPKRVSG